MRKTFLILLLALGLGLGVGSSAAAVTASITGPTDIFVPYADCVRVTWYASTAGVETFDWTWDGTQVSTTSSYSRSFCSPNLDNASTEDFTLGLYVTGGGQADYTEIYPHVIYEGSCSQPFCSP